jgi:hypothetical protein
MLRRGGRALALGVVTSLAALSLHAASPRVRGKVNVAPEVAVTVPDGWSEAPRFSRNTTDFVAVPADRQNQVKVPQRLADGTISRWTGRVTVFTEAKANHQEALDRLKEIAGESSSPATFLTIGGWPALERSYVADLPHRGWEEAEVPDLGKAIFTTTAIAVDRLVVRFDGVLPPQSEPAAVELSLGIAHGAAIAKQADPATTARDVEELKVAPQRTFSLFKAGPPQASALVAPGVTAQGAGAALDIVSGSSEIEITSSPNGQDVVAAAQNNFRTSNDGGQSFGWSGNMPFGNYGDPSLAYGQSGRFYYAGIHFLAGCTGNPLFGCGTAVSSSTNRGHTFGNVNDAVVCPSSGGSACFPDQEHIAADRWNAGGSGDQVYSVWRNFTAGEIPNIVCSQDNGVNWTAPTAVDSGYVPRVTVGQDGFVYVVYGQSGNIRVNKYSSCASGLAVQSGFPKTITSYTGVTCPVAGLDRCNDGNVLASYMLAVDETAPANVFLAYADTDGSGGENILLRKSADGGATWGAPTTINGGATGVVRYMPWISVNGGVVHISWYDRRAGQDKTDFYRRSVNAGTLALGAETSLQQNTDPECNSGWPCGTRASGDSETCPSQPQLAGFCQDGSGNNDPSNTRCDFSSPSCPSGYTNCNTAGGCPKYGDYNGNAASGGRAFSAWASAIAPPGSTNSGNIDTYFEAAQIGPDPDVSIGKTGPASVNAKGSIHYVITVTNNDTTLATGIQVNDTITSPYVTVNSSDPWTYVNAPAVGSTGLLTCNLASLPGGASSTLDVYVTAPNIIGSRTDQATVSSSNDANTANNTSPLVTTTIYSPSDVYGTKTWSSAWGLNTYPGAPVTYTIVLTNIAANDQFDNASHEFVDVVPAQLTVNSVSASSGTASSSGNTVYWDGLIAGNNGSVTITINCTINLGTEGQMVSNQGTIHYDAVGDGSNSGTRSTDDPTVGGDSDPTVFQIRTPVPTLGTVGLGALLVLLAATAAFALWRRHRFA